MLDILGITGPIYIAIALGYLVTRAGLFSRADMRVLGKFVIHVALPAMLFNALSQRRIQEIVNGPYLLVYTLGTLLTLAFGWAWARRGARQDATTSVYYAMGMCCSNSGFVAFPIALLVIGPMAGVMLGLNMIVENLLVLPLLLAMAEASTGQGGRWYVVLRQSLLALARNPMVLGLIAGFIVSWMGWRVPSPMDRSITLFAQTSAALSLFAIGGSLAGQSMAGLWRPVAQIAAGKLLLHPLLMLGVLLAVEAAGLGPLDPQLRAAVLLTAACPMMGIYPVLAQRHGREGLAAAASLGTTVASFFSISALLWLVSHLPH